MDELKSFFEWNKQIFKAQDENKLIDLYHVELDGKTSTTVIADVLFKKQNIHELPYSVFKIHDEFIAISKDIKYVTGILFLLRPYIIDTEESDGRYFQNLPDRRYLVYSTFALQSVYNFWDRLGDMLYLYFPTNLHANNVYFAKVLQQISEDYQKTKPYLELKDLYQEMQLLLKLRNQTVHHFQMETFHYWGNIQNIHDEEERNKLNKDKFTYPEKLKEALHLSNKAFIAAVYLIDELPDKAERE